MYLLHRFLPAIKGALCPCGVILLLTIYFVVQCQNVKNINL